MAAFYRQRPSNVQEASLRYRIVTKTFVSAEGCIIWKGARTRKGYGKMKVTSGGREETLSPHRLLYFLDSGLNNLDPTMQVSHLCHEKRCVNLAHLSLEQNVVNQQRKNCFAEKHCMGHPQHPDCIIIH
uniref:Zinc-binding loop region of homing endonuclease domain-containing protein n=1 Tax=Branchiostoma floridae TaxID=7739 RepID=C3XPK2_BRAFL|eukprot:XP_002595500.1 hypothetical protein BRAFLDRAFT_69099 [Branchiostoma floridae]